MKKVKKFFLIVLTILIVGLLVFGYWRYYVPFSDDGVKAGMLNNIKHKGVVFKTYEGELIQTGFSPGQKGLQSNEFQFSVENEALALKLMNLSGQEVKLHYKEYYATLPWRGYTKFIVDSLMSVEPVQQNQQQVVPPYTGGQ